MRQEEKNFINGIYDFGRDCGLDRRDTIRLILKLAQRLVPEEDRWKSGKHPLLVCDQDIDEETERKWIEFHEKIVQSILDFINENPKIIEISEKIREIRKKSLEFDPSLSVFLTLDSIGESLKNKKWVCSLDSGLVLDCGGQTVLESL
jgi:hypothetical protein